MIIDHRLLASGAILSQVRAGGSDHPAGSRGDMAILKVFRVTSLDGLVTRHRQNFAARRRARVVFGGASTALLLAMGGAALAQGVPNLPQSINPGRLPNELPPAQPGAGTSELQLPRSGGLGAPAPAAAKTVHFKLTDVSVEGVTVYPADTFRPIYADKIGQVVSLADVYDWAEAITRRYRGDGYIISLAVVPAQHIHGGVVRITVLEGYVAKVTVQGPTSPRLHEYAEKLTEVRPLTSAVLERYLLLANELPGMTVRSVFAPSEGVPGAADVTLVTTRKTIDGSAEVDNHGTKYIGPWQDTESVGVNNIFGHDERIVFRYAGVSSLRELNLFDLSGSMPIDGDGDSVVIEGTRTRGRPGYLLAKFDPHTSGDSFSIAAQRALIRSRIENLTAVVTFSYQDAITDLEFFGPDRPPSSNDKIRALRASASYNNIDPWGGTNSLSAEFSQGLPIFDASRNGRPNPSRPNGDAVFTKYTMNVSRLQTIDAKDSLLLAISEQYAFGDSLLSSEQFGVGGAQFGRGYDPSEITGDNGLAGKLEFQHNEQFTLLQPRLAQFYGFYDWGLVGNNFVGNGQPAKATLASLGAGVRLNLEDGLVSSLELAKPLTRPVAADVGVEDPKGLHVYFSLLYSF